MNSPLNTPRQFLALNSVGVVFEDNTPVLGAKAVLIIKKSRGVTATTVYPKEETGCLYCRKQCEKDCLTLLYLYL